MQLFITNLLSDNPADRFYFFAVVLVVIVSIVLHELAHGVAALRLGDRTPILQNRMTGNPLVHMGPFSLLALALAGIAWGQMPIDPTRLRGRYGELIVAAAGPALNLALALVCLSGLAVLLRAWTFPGFPPAAALSADLASLNLGLSPLQQNVLRLLAIAGLYNLILLFFNLLPVPPLDGSHILANLSRPYADFIGDPKNSGALMIGFIFCFAVASGPLVVLSVKLMSAYVSLFN